MHFKYGCDGRQRCEAFCTGPLENFPYYDQTAKKCIREYNYEYPYCGKRNEARYHNHQCISNYDSYGTKKVIGYRCLNRKDIGENFIRSSVNYKKFVSYRKNLFEYFKANDTRNQVTGNHIICDSQNITMQCEGRFRNYIIECKKEETDIGGILVTNNDVCDALDLLEDKGLPSPSENWMQYIYLARPVR